MNERLMISTSGIEPRHRLDYWRSTISDSYAPVEIRDYQTKNFEAEIVATSVGDLSLTNVTSVPQTFVRPKSLIKSGHCDDYVAAIQLDSVNRHAANGHEIVTTGYSITLYDLTRPFLCQSVDRVSCIDVHLPRDVFEGVLGPASDAVGLTISPAQASGPMICGFFRDLMEGVDRFDPSTAARMAAIGVDLLAAGFAERLGREPWDGRSAVALVCRAKSFIDDHLGDTRLDTAAIAAALSLSVRRLQEVFAEQDLTVDGYLWDRRIAKARMHLRNPAFDAVSIADVGHGVGFGSAAHFARRFRSRFEMPPSEYRARAHLERTLTNGPLH